MGKESFNGLTFFRGRVGLFSILKGLSIGIGDDVITQAFTCIAVPEAIIATGANPIYVDISENSVTMDANDLAIKITPRTRAIIVQHTFGIPADMDYIIAVANKHSIPIIEDCCHVSYSTYKDKEVGSFGVGSFYSYEWGKPIVAGIGGSVKINANDLYAKVEALRNRMATPTKKRQIRLIAQYMIYSLIYRPLLYWPIKDLFHKMDDLGLVEGNFNQIESNEEIGSDFNLKMARFNEWILLRKIRRGTQFMEHSRRVSSEYKDKINSSVVSHHKIKEGMTVVYARYPLLSKNKHELLKKARTSNVEIADWYKTPIHPLKENECGLVNYIPHSCPNAEALCEQIVSLPVGERVRLSDVNRIISFLNEVQI